MKTSALFPPEATPRRRRLLLTVGLVLFVAGFFVWPGCGSIPLRASRTTPGPVQMKDVKEALESGLSKTEVFAKFGEPDEWYGDLRVACYKLNGLQRTNVYIFFGIPVGTDHEKEAGIEVAMMQFDARGAQLRQTRQRILGYNPEKSMRSEAEHWIQGKTATGKH
jgi:hypothetical protein